MKHGYHITGLLLLIFVLAQINGFFVLDYYIDIAESARTGQTVVHDEAYKQSNITPPEVENESTSYIYVMIALLIGTVLVLVLIRFKQKRIWKAWFFLSVAIALIISINSWMFRFFAKSGIEPLILYGITVGLCCVIAWYKVFKHNVIIHNVSEIFIYAGIGALLIPLFNVFSASVLLILIAVYDAYAVWKSKHMIAMAEFQTAEKVFAGLYIPYKSDVNALSAFQKKTATKKYGKNTKQHITTAVLGGGDIAFPLLFSGVIMKTTGLWWPALLITGTTVTALALLFIFGKKGKYYPAIPFIAAGCFVGYGIVLLL